MYAFDILRPTTIADAVAALAQDGALALGGGQTLIPSLKQRLASPAVLVSLTAIPAMRGVCLTDDGAVAVGGATPHAIVAEHPTRGLDVRAAARVHAALRAVAETGAGAAVVCSTDLDEVFALTTRIVVCFAGTVTEIAPAADPRDRSAYARALLGASA